MQDSLASFYKTRSEYPNFVAQWKDDITFLKKLKVSLRDSGLNVQVSPLLQISLSAVQPKFPQENSDDTFMSYIEQLVV